MFLERIVAATRQRLEEKKRCLPLREVKQRLKAASPVRGFAESLHGEGIRLIAEVKRASPSKGWLRPDLKVALLVQSYAQGGAAALSVLTEPLFFQGSLDDLAVARQAVGLPVLCKDFILEDYQIYEARSWGADAVLLIAAILSPSQLKVLLETAHSLGIGALVEVHQEEEVETALAAGAKMVGINNRNLADFTVSLETTMRLRPLIPGSLPVVSESGIKSREDIVFLHNVGVNGVLVGESLVIAPDPAAKIRELLCV